MGVLYNNTKDQLFILLNMNQIFILEGEYHTKSIKNLLLTDFTYFQISYIIFMIYKQQKQFKLTNI